MDSPTTDPLSRSQPQLLLLNQMAGPMTWELAVDLSRARGNRRPADRAPGHTAQGIATGRAAAPLSHLSAGQWHWFARGVGCGTPGKHSAGHGRFPADIPLVAFSNPPIVIWVCWLLRRLRGTPYAVMVHDIYPDTAIRLGAASDRQLLVRIWRWLNRHAYEQASVVMTLGEHMAAHLSVQFDADKTTRGTRDRDCTVGRRADACDPFPSRRIGLRKSTSKQIASR